TYHNWTRAVREHRDITLDLDALLRLSAVLGVHQALQVLHGTEADGIAWLRRPNLAIVFGGQTPLDLLTSGSQDAILTVRRFLDAARGGLSMTPNAVDRDFVPYGDADIVFS
ncbi:MAG: MbcA/ParS/Xre antitoxin family protein, partial [Beijerinckiaceae bacterium]